MSEQVVSLALHNLLATRKSQATKDSYKMAIDGFLKWLKVPKGDYDILLTKDPKALQTDICNFIVDLVKWTLQRTIHPHLYHCMS
jgi:hypothetical protein